MTTFDYDSELGAALDLLVPLDWSITPDWTQVERRLPVSGQRQRRRRRVVLAFALLALCSVALAVTTPLGGAFTRGVGGFTSWLSGTIGSPATSDQQQAFDQSNRHSWTGFPDGTKVRQLVSQDVDGVHYTLLGFRSGSDLCLRAQAADETQPRDFSCVPVSALQSARSPVVVVRVDHPLNPDVGTPRRLRTATFGIVADGVRAITVTSDESDAGAELGSNAFLSVLTPDNVSNRVRGLRATTEDGRTISVPIAAAPFGTWERPANPTGKALGPSRIERTVDLGTVGWIQRREPRGDPAPAALRDRVFGRTLATHVVLARLITPDPNSSAKALIMSIEAPNGDPLTSRVVGNKVCMFTVTSNSAGGGCDPRDAMFFDGPFWVSQMLAEGGDQYETLSGLANDEVKRMTLYQADGEVISVPLRDNAYVVRANRTAYPVRLVAYDGAARVIGIKTLPGNGR